MLRRPLAPRGRVSPTAPLTHLAAHGRPHRSIDHLRRVPRFRPSVARRHAGPLGSRPDLGRDLKRHCGDAVRARFTICRRSSATVIELGFFGGYSHSQIAERLATPLGTVKKRMRSGLKRMRRRSTTVSQGQCRERSSRFRSDRRLRTRKLDAAERQRVRDHLATCAECRRIRRGPQRPRRDAQRPAVRAAAGGPARAHHGARDGRARTAAGRCAHPAEPAPAPAVLPYPRRFLPVAAQPPTLAVHRRHRAPRGAGSRVGRGAGGRAAVDGGSAMLGLIQDCARPSHTVASVTASPESARPRYLRTDGAPGGESRRARAIHGRRHPNTRRPHGRSRAATRVAHLESVIAQERARPAFRAGARPAAHRRTAIRPRAAPGRTVAVAPAAAASPVPAAAPPRARRRRRTSPRNFVRRSAPAASSASTARSQEPWHFDRRQPPGGATHSSSRASATRGRRNLSPTRWVVRDLQDVSTRAQCREHAGEAGDADAAGADGDVVACHPRAGRIGRSPDLGVSFDASWTIKSRSGTRVGRSSTNAHLRTDHGR